MYIRTALAAALAAIILMVMPLSAGYSEAEYRGNILIENAGSPVNGAVVRLDLNTDALVNGGLMDSSFQNAWITNSAGNGMAFMPKPGSNGQWYFYYPWQLPGHSSVLGYLYMGGPDMSPPLYYIPGAGGMTRADTANMELGSNFAIEQRGFIDTSYAADKRLVYKSGAFQTYVSSEGVISSVIGTPTTVRPTGYSDPDNHWSDETKAYDNNTSTSAYTTMWPSGYLELTRAASVTNAIHMRLSSTIGSPGIGVAVDYYNGVTWINCYNDIFPGTSAEWHTFPMDQYDVVYAVRIRNNTTPGSALFVYEIDWPAVGCAVSAPVASGVHTIRTEADGSDLKLYVDGALKGSTALGGASVTNNANSWSFLTNGVMPYMEYHKLWVGGTLRQHIEWENDATFHDLSGNNNDVTPSFPSGSSDPDVSASLSTLTPLSTAVVPGGDAGEGEGMMPGLPAEPDGLYREMQIDHLPGAAVINALLDVGGIPRTLFWFPATFIAITILSLVAYKLTKSLMAMGLVAAVALVFSSKAGIVPYWVTVPVVLVAAAVLIKEKMSPL